MGFPKPRRGKAEPYRNVLRQSRSAWFLIIGLFLVSSLTNLTNVQSNDSLKGLEMPVQ